MKNKYDIIVVGAGHAGCEAAYVAAKLGSKVLLVTMDMNKIAQMSCNPAVGGIAKGQIVREIDALGGAMGIVTDYSTIQFRMLNRSKGPAMWSPRAQCDRMLYSSKWREILENTSNLTIWQDTVESFILNTSKGVDGITTSMGAEFYSNSVILTAGTFLNGKLYIGTNTTQGGRIGELSSYNLSEQLKDAGILTDKMKTGTPPRIDARSIDFSKLPIQEGDIQPQKFSYAPILSAIQKENSKQMPCYIVHTNKDVHKILESGFEFSPLFTGKIHGKGPRYCPSIEDKLKTFSDKDQHQLFLEPEGWNTNEYYLQGFSSSLPLSTQMEALRAIKGLENVNIYRPAYAVEYDYFPPTQLYHTLESKIIKNLYFAGQVNGTTGYEEAAAQGIVAGINAHQSTISKEPFILKRDQAYIGVLIDDLVTKGVDEPYRMFTSRAEYRILLRQDNADLRLTQLSNSIGLATVEQLERVKNKYKAIDSIEKHFRTTNITPLEINSYLNSIGSSLIDKPKKISDIITRPEVNVFELIKHVPCGTLTQINEQSNEVLESVEINIKYKGYIERERKIAEKIQRLEDIKIPDNFNYDQVKSITHESRQKLSRIRPTTISQASRIPGVSPADISVLLVYFGR